MIRRLLLIIVFLVLGSPRIYAQGAAEEKWPEESYITEIREITRKVRHDYSVEETAHTRIKIQKEEARYWGSIPLNYDADIEQVKDIEAFVITGDGQQIKYKEVYDVPLYQDMSTYSNARRKIITLPEVNVGSTIDWRYTIISQPIIEEGFWATNFEIVDSPTKQAIYKIITPKSMKIKIFYYNNPKKPKIEDTQDERIYTWEISDADKTKFEEFMPPDTEVIPWTGMTTLGSWKVINDWYSKKFSRNTHADNDIRNKVKELIKNGTDNLKKVDAIVKYLQDNFRYVSIAGFYTFGPHPASEVFKNKYGDCEDQCCLLITMLKECGIKATPALYRSAIQGKIYEELPMLNFNHVIIMARINKKPYFIDPLMEGYHITEIPYDMQGANLFVINEKGGSIQTLATLDETADQDIYKVKTKIMSDGSAIKETEYTYNKTDSISRKKMYRAMGEREKSDFLAQLESSETSGGKLVSLDWGDIDDLYMPLRIKSKFTIPEWVSVQGDYMIFQPLSPSRADMFALRERRFPIMFSGNSLDKWHLEYEIPSDFQIICVPKDFYLATQLSECSSKFKVEGNNIIHDYIFRYKKGSLPASNYADLKDFYDRIAKYAKQYIILKKIKKE